MVHRQRLTIACGSKVEYPRPWAAYLATSESFRPSARKSLDVLSLNGINTNGSIAHYASQQLRSTVVELLRPIYEGILSPGGEITVVIAATQAPLDYNNI